jgi:hypothetical protein
MARGVRSGGREAIGANNNGSWLLGILIGWIYVRLDLGSGDFLHPGGRTFVRK